MRTAPTPTPVVQKTTVKDEPLQLDRVPSGEPYALNYQQTKPVLEIRKRIWLKLLLLAVLTNVMLATYLAAASTLPILIAVIMFATVVLSLIGVVSAA